MKDGKIAKEQDFFDMQSLILQLQKPSEEEVVVDDYTGIYDVILDRTLFISVSKSSIRTIYIDNPD